MEGIDFDQLPKESLIALVKEKISQEKAKDDALKKAEDEKAGLKKKLEDNDKLLEKSLMVGGTVTEKLKDIPTICKIVKMDDQYSGFLQQMLEKKETDYFLTAINARVQPLIERSKMSIQDAQVDESGEALITTLEDLDKSLFKPYENAGMIDENFTKKYLDSRSKFYAFKRMLTLWQNYMVEVYNLMLASQHAYLHAQKVKNPSTPLVIDSDEQEENNRIKELEGKIKEQNDAYRKLEARLNMIDKQFSSARAEEVREQDLNMLDEAKTLAGPDEALPDAPEAETEERKGRRRGRD